MFFISTVTSPKTIIELPTKLYVDSLHENNRKKTRLFKTFQGAGH